MNLVRKIAENYKLPYYTMSPTYSICTTHGYINGEQYTCPECGKTTEVYSRITGYYRPVQNWNDGKSQEFKQRKEYDISKSHLCKCKENPPLANPAANEVVMPNTSTRPVLFTTKTCPNCKMAKMLLSKAGIEVEVIDAQENAELTKKYNVTKAPTMFVTAPQIS